MGDGSSDLPVMMHVNQYDGLTIAVSEAKFITRVARRTVLSDNAMSVLVPVLEEVLRWDSATIRRFFAARGLTLREWDKMAPTCSLLTKAPAPPPPPPLNKAISPLAYIAVGRVSFPGRGTVRPRRMRPVRTML